MNNPSPASLTQQPLLRVRGLVKQLGGTLALGGVDFDVDRGEIHALLGANGAGKSTLIKTLAGIHVPDAGQIELNGRRLDGYGPHPPIAFIHQDLGLFGWMTVAENIAMVRGYALQARMIDWRRVRANAERALLALGADIDPDARVSDLSRTDRSVVAIVRALTVDADLLVLDEPTASLPESEVARLFDVLRRLAGRGVGIIYVSHRLDEVFRLADRVTVLRDGKKVGTRLVRESTPADLVLMIVGRPPSEVFLGPPQSSARPALQVDGLRVGPVGPISFEVMAGEIIGLAGLRGAGQNAVGRALAGIDPITEGTIRLHGQEITPRSPLEAWHAGIAFTTSNREEESLAMALSVTENLFLNPAARGRPVWRWLWHAAERTAALHLVERFSVRPRDPDRPVSTLSGGNQQKVVLARWLGVGARLLVMEEPTAGVDVGSKAEIYAMLDAELTRGTAIVLVSSDLDEVAGICNRACIFNRGRIVSELPRDRLSVATLTALVGGAGTIT